MGGNARALNENGEIICYAEPISFEKLKRLRFVWETKLVLKELDKLYNEKYNEPLWKYFQIIENGEAFNGSSRHLFNPQLMDCEFLAFKEEVGDIDLTVDRNKLKNLYYLLKELEGKYIVNFKYMGQCKPSFYGHQINSVFQFSHKGINYFPQIDFEGCTYENNSPSKFSKFSHSASWEDIKRGYKGVFHKYLLINLVRAISEDESMLILTPKSKETPDKIRKKTLHELPRRLAFSIDRGLREKYKKVEGLVVEGKQCYKDLSTNDSYYETDIVRIFKTLFPKANIDYFLNKNGTIEQFWSFSGLMELIKEFYDEDIITKIYRYLICNNLWGNGAQGLYRNDPGKDRKIKERMINALFKKFPYLEDVDKDEFYRMKEVDYYPYYKKVGVLE